MKILVVPRKYVAQFSANSDFFKNNNFISIGEFEGHEGVSASGPNILKLVFEDVSDKEDGIKFSTEHAQQIKDFIDRIDKSKTLFINCQAGISRSGAVGEVLNDYVNCMLNNGKKNEDHHINEINNRHIRPNAWVKSVLKQVLGFYDGMKF